MCAYEFMFMCMHTHINIPVSAFTNLHINIHIPVSAHMNLHINIHVHILHMYSYI